MTWCKTTLKLGCRRRANPHDTSALKSPPRIRIFVVFGGESDDDDDTHTNDDGFPELGTTTTTTTTTKKRDDGQNGGGWWSRRRPEENYASERSENGGVFVPRGESGTNPLKDPMAIIGIVGIVGVPALILLIGVTSGYIGQ